MNSFSLSFGIISENSNISGQLNKLKSRSLTHSVLFQTNDFAKGENQLKKLKPDILVLESGLIKDGLPEVLLKLKMSHPQCKVILLVETYSLNLWLRYLNTGVKAILENPETEILLSAVSSAYYGGIYLDPLWGEKFLEDCAVKAARKEREWLLTEREIQILKVLAEGNSVRQAGNILDLSSKTINTHKANIMRKLNFHNRTDLVKYAIRKKIVSIGEE